MSSSTFSLEKQDLMNVASGGWMAQRFTQGEFINTIV